MRCLIGLSVAIVLIAVNQSTASKYPVTTESGAWMILVQSYTGETSAQLADELADSLRRDYKLASFVFNRGAEERRKERERVETVRRQHRERAKAAGLPDDAPLPPVKTFRVEDSHAVLVGGWKDMETARKELDKIRKLQPPAERLMHKTYIADAAPDGVKPSTNKTSPDQKVLQSSGVNPFKSAFVVRNPLVPLPPEPEKGKLQNLKDYNSGESYSLLKCRKPFTLMVKSYQGAVTLVSAKSEASSFLEKLGGAKPGQILNATAQQAHDLAKALTLLKDKQGRAVIETDVYVLHTESGSYVCVGGFDRPDDPTLLAYQKKLANLSFGGVEALSSQPMPMPVPKP